MFSNEGPVIRQSESVAQKIWFYTKLCCRLVLSHAFWYIKTALVYFFGGLLQALGFLTGLLIGLVLAISTFEYFLPVLSVLVKLVVIALKLLVALL